MAWDQILALVSQAATSRRDLTAQTRLFGLGETVTEVFFIIDGEVEYLLPGAPPVTLAHREQGALIGEEFALTGRPAQYEALCRTPASLLILTREQLTDLIHTSREFADFFIAREMEERLAVQATTGKMQERSNLLEAHIAQQAAIHHGELLGQSPPMVALRAALEAQGASLEPLLLLGEPGAGKELAAIHLHTHGARQTEPLVSIHASEWTEARWNELVAMAAGGTILIKEVTELSAEAASAVGALCVAADAVTPRLIGTATVRPGAPLVLPAPWERVAQIEVPALRERKVDIPEVARAFVRSVDEQYASLEESITSEAMRRLVTYPYLERNVAELKAVITRAAHLAGGEPIRPEHLVLGAQGRTGRPLVGLALGGGVVRGMAHIGVLQVLQAEGIPIDIVAGTSVGSLVGAAFAGGVDLQELERIVPSLSWPKLVAPSWPKNGMLNSTKLGRFMESLIGRKRIEELRIPYAAVAVDHSTGEEVILREGPVSSAIRASAAIPGLFQPIQMGGRRLIDGGLVNNVPASVVRSMGADLVIAVDVRDYNYFDPGEAGGLLVSFLRGYDIMIHRAARSELEWADIAIWATKAGSNPYSFKMAGELIEAGREQAMKAVPSIRRALRELEERVG